VGFDDFFNGLLPYKMVVIQLGKLVLHNLLRYADKVSDGFF